MQILRHRIQINKDKNFKLKILFTEHAANDAKRSRSTLRPIQQF